MAELYKLSITPLSKYKSNHSFLFLVPLYKLYHYPCRMHPIIFFLLPFLCFLFAILLLYSPTLRGFIWLPFGVRRLPLPPGGMGWPYVGQSLHLYNNNATKFLSRKQDKHGSIFKTHLLGCPCVMVASSEAAKFVLLTGANLFKPTFPASKERMIGTKAIFFQQGEYHARLRRLVLRAFMPEALRKNVGTIEQIALHVLRSWEGQMINTYQEMKNYSFNVALVSIFGKDQMSCCLEEVKQCYYTLEKGYNSTSFNLPGTLFYKAMKARKRLEEIITDILASRRQVSGSEFNDLLGSFMQSKVALSDDQIVDNIIGVIFAARDTTASVLTWIVKYLGEDAGVLQAVIKEQLEIVKDRENKSLNWGDTRKMPVTSRVIQETMRVASILSFTFREAVQDVEYEGFHIPKGWKVLPLFRLIHHSEKNFPNPLKFDPNRFQVAPKPNTFLPFGSGTHSCPGNEMAKLEILVLLHHLVLKYSWSIPDSDNDIQFGPFALPSNGLPVRISLKTI